MAKDELKGSECNDGRRGGPQEIGYDPPVEAPHTLLPQDLHSHQQHRNRICSSGSALAPTTQEQDMLISPAVRNSSAQTSSVASSFADLHSHQQARNRTSACACFIVHTRQLLLDMSCQCALLLQDLHMQQGVPSRQETGQEYYEPKATHEQTTCMNREGIKEPENSNCTR